MRASFLAASSKKSGPTTLNDYNSVYSAGHRQNIITATSSFFSAAVTTALVDGDKTTNVNYFASASVTSSDYIRFQFPTGQIITELKFYQSGTTSHATYQLRGSDDASSWTDIGSSFTLGGSTAQTITEASANTTAYIYYELRGVSGSNSNASYIYEFEFKISRTGTSESVVADYLEGCSAGNRTTWMTVSTTFANVGDENITVNGNTSDNGFYFQAGGSADQYMKFAFDAAKVVTEAKWYQSTSDNHSVVQWQGSNNDSTWTNIGSTFTLGGASPQTQTELSGNTTAYLYYQMLYVSGSNSGNPYIYEIQFKISRTIPA